MQLVRAKDKRWREIRSSKLTALIIINRCSYPSCFLRTVLEAAAIAEYKLYLMLVAGVK